MQEISRVFLSYGHDKNSVIVEAIAADLSGRGYDVWIDIDGLHSGDDWRRTITEEIQKREAMISFASNHSVRDPGVCLDELSIAVSIKGAQIQSVLLEKNVDPPINVSFRQYIDMSDWREYWGTDEFQGWFDQKMEVIIRSIDSPEVRQYSHEMIRIKELLEPELASPKKDGLGKQLYCGREWLKQIIDQKIENGGKSILLVGSPGCGKSSFMAHEFINNQNVGAIVFCEWDNPTANNIDAVSRTIAFQLAARNPDYRMRLLEVLEKEKANGFQSEKNAFTRYIIDPLRYLIDGNRPYTYILIDGLDEVEDRSSDKRMNNELAEMLEGSLDRFPRWIKFVVSSRADLKVTKPLGNFDTIVVDEHMTDNDEDIHLFLSMRLGGLAPSDSEIAKLEKNCKGNFLYAKLICDEIEKNGLSIEEACTKVDSIARIYLHYFDRALRGIDPEESGIYDALCAMCVVREPIPFVSLKRAINWKTFQAKTFLKVMGPYLSVDKSNEEPSGNITLFHKSFIDWLLSDEAEEYEVDPDIGNSVIAKACYAAYKNGISSMNDFELKYVVQSVDHADSAAKDTILGDARLADLLLERAQANKEKRRYTAAISYAESAKRIYIGNTVSEDDLFHVIECFQIIATCYDLQVELEDAVRTGKTAIHYIETQRIISVQESKSLKREIGLLYLMLGFVYSRLNDWKNADGSFGEAYSCFKDAGDQKNMLLAVDGRALNLRNESRYEEAINLYRDLEKDMSYPEIREEYPDVYAILRMNLGWCFYANGQYAEAKELFLESLALIEDQTAKVPLKYVAQIYYYMSIIESSYADYEKAYMFVDEALKYVKLVYGDDAVEICSALNQEGWINLKQKQYPKARKSFRRAYEIRVNYYGLQNIYTSISLRNLARVGIGEGTESSCKDALEKIELALSIREKLYRDHPRNGNIAMLYIDKADCYEKLGNYEQARLSVDYAIEIYREVKQENDLARAILTRGIIEKKSGEMEEARKDLLFARAIMLPHYGRVDHPHIMKIDALLKEIEAEA